MPAAMAPASTPTPSSTGHTALLRTLEATVVTTPAYGGRINQRGIGGRGPGQKLISPVISIFSGHRDAFRMLECRE
jgi:hypothetical protein